jgi:hypothetical protein
MSSRSGRVSTGLSIQAVTVEVSVYSAIGVLLESRRIAVMLNPSGPAWEGGAVTWSPHLITCRRGETALAGCDGLPGEGRLTIEGRSRSVVLRFPQPATHRTATVAAAARAAIGGRFDERGTRMGMRLQLPSASGVTFKDDAGGMDPTRRPIRNPGVGDHLARITAGQRAGPRSGARSSE